MILRSFIRTRNYRLYVLCLFLILILYISIFCLFSGKLQKSNFLIFYALLYSISLSVVLGSFIELIINGLRFKEAIILDDDSIYPHNIKFNIKGKFISDVFYTDKKTFNDLKRIKISDRFNICVFGTSIKLLSYHGNNNDHIKDYVGTVYIEGDIKYYAKLKLKYG